MFRSKRHSKEDWEIKKAEALRLQAKKKRENDEFLRRRFPNKVATHKCGGPKMYTIGITSRPDQREVKVVFYSENLGDFQYHTFPIEQLESADA